MFWSTTVSGSTLLGKFAWRRSAAFATKAVEEEMRELENHRQGNRPAARNGA
jgi:hypothetical protein